MYCCTTSATLETLASLGPFRRRLILTIVQMTFPMYARSDYRMGSWAIFVRLPAEAHVLQPNFGGAKVTSHIRSS